MSESAVNEERDDMTHKPTWVYAAGFRRFSPRAFRTAVWDAITYLLEYVGSL